ncbi:hypothetical protein [Pseudomonas viridiflava]|uniref:hypothetical protein n=1 Tax=Pseudomonas viridiflava TaxID=33069 RepID=UPI0010FA662F|nr:hypothetical protein [Pseudomonas viridiflava]
MIAESVMRYGQPLENEFDLVVFFYLPAELRLERLERREIKRFGKAKREFLAWAAQYDAGDIFGRGLTRHQEWLAAPSCAVLGLEVGMNVTDRVRQILGTVDKLNHTPSAISIQS